MKKVAFISDIHSNQPALESVLNDIKSRNIDFIYCLGDIIGYHSFPNEVIELLKANHVISIKGNHDEVITEKKFNRDNNDDFVLYWNYDKLTEENLKFLEHLPNCIEFQVENIDVKIVHGSPDSSSEYIRKDSSQIDKYFGLMETDILVCGHTHIPYIAQKDNKYILNSGSVGKSKWGRPQGSYILLTVNNSDFDIEIIYVNYDYNKMVNHLKNNYFPEKLIEAIKTGLP
ncbi:MAG: metallophosphoesterase family protein [Spirochaetales bacterium]|nr:metallophosphoesterase family protein [Spirochaetales bacterium]